MREVRIDSYEDLITFSEGQNNTPSVKACSLLSMMTSLTAYSMFYVGR
jgi:hypothetical protein